MKINLKKESFIFNFSQFTLSKIKNSLLVSSKTCITVAHKKLLAQFFLLYLTDYKLPETTRRRKNGFDAFENGFSPNHGFSTIYGHLDPKRPCCTQHCVAEEMKINLSRMQASSPKCITSVLRVCKSTVNIENNIETLQKSTLTLSRFSMF